MDDPNFKMKNIYNSVNSSEIALRCTILDLCQRLKRMEVLCDYYEQCRNELVSDCIRLRQERDYYLMAHENSLQKLEASKQKNITVNNSNSNPNPGTPEEINQLDQTNKIQSNFSFEKDIDFTKTSEPDNYEEITKRLIAQFKEEMKEIKRASMNGPQQPTSSNQNETMALGCHVSKGSDQIQQPPPLQLLQPPQPQPPQPSSQQQQGPTSSANSESEQYLDLCIILAKGGINDFDTLTQMLMNQNEKLRKLKGKQLRSYFKRQLEQNTT